jgi:hypothetical protein
LLLFFVAGNLAAGFFAALVTRGLVAAGTVLRAGGTRFVTVLVAALTVDALASALGRVALVVVGLVEDFSLDGMVGDARSEKRYIQFISFIPGCKALC